LWQPEEIGEFLGRIVADEMELDYLVNILGQLATKIRIFLFSLISSVSV
jgi:hypothetical protein